MSWPEKPKENLEDTLDKYLADLKDRLEKETGNIHDIESARKHQERELRLGDQLCKFMDQIHLFCAWDNNARKKSGGRLWRSKVVGREEVEQVTLIRDHSEYNRPYGSDNPELSKSHPATVYKFDCDGTLHKVVYYEDREMGSDPDGRFYYQLLEVYKGDRPVFLSHCSDLERYGGSGKSSYMIAFIPGPWVNLLIERCKKLEIEDKGWAVKDEYNSGRIEQLKKNFLE